jgi:hypothetical protein
MTNGDIELSRILEEAARAAAGPRVTAEEGAPLLAEAGGGEAEGEVERQAESTLGLLSPQWQSLAPVKPAEASSGTSSKGVAWLNPLVGGLLSLFGGDEESAAAEPAKAVRASKIHYEAGFGGEGGELVEIDRDERGQARPAAVQPQVVVNIEAMDSRSFLDRTPEIAEAMKRALLESESINRLAGGE